MTARHFNTLKWFKSFSDETQKIIYQRVMPELMILTAINQFDGYNDCMNMLHGEQCTKHQWIQDYNLPVSFCDDVWHIMRKMGSQNYCQPVLALMSLMVLFGSDRGTGFISVILYYTFRYYH